jgi:hypothetical protein
MTKKDQMRKRLTQPRANKTLLKEKVFSPSIQEGV